ncbi:MAG: NAD(P)/FAD-dependent oxidoreductase [Coriobacteriales bacterium]|jgi:thioredoxin reductase (NADPH)|nr:NAD(P)/FAD-dependent oxidoreductase [Coriobacteriales bacterium]
MYDIAIIGGGPAGLSAAITARARNKEVLIISNPAEENPLAASKLVDNYPGMPGATGLHLLTTMHAQAHRAGTKFLQARAISVVPMSGGEPLQTSFSVTTSSDYVEARSLIIACGAASGGKPLKGEREYLGRGVSYCATCDGMLYRSSTVLIAGLSHEAADEADFMAELGATVHYVAEDLPPSLDARVQRHRGRLLAIEGDSLGVTHARIAERPAESPRGPELENKTTASLRDEPKELELAVHGVFILRPGIALTTLLPSLATDGGYLKVDAQMRTNLEGVFAAGDCTGRPLQVAKAVGEGQVAVLSAVEYLRA